MNQFNKCDFHTYNSNGQCSGCGRFAVDQQILDADIASEIEFFSNCCGFLENKVFNSDTQICGECHDHCEYVQIGKTD